MKTVKLEEASRRLLSSVARLKIMYPAADVPCVQSSLLGLLDPESHLVIGKALMRLGVGCFAYWLGGLVA